MPVAKRKIEALNDFSAGMHTDYKNVVQPPAYPLLLNLWLTPDKQLRSRPHLIPVTGHEVDDIFRTHENQLGYISNGLIYIDGEAVGSIAGSGRTSYDIYAGGTVVTRGAFPVIWDGSHLTTINQSNTYTLATTFGFNKQRLFIAQSDKPNQIKYSAIANFEDWGTVLVDTQNISDERSESRSTPFFPFKILNLMSLLEEPYVFTALGIYRINSNEGEYGYEAHVELMRELETWDVLPKKVEAGEGAKAHGAIVFVNSNGLYTVEHGYLKRGMPEIKPLPTIGVARTIDNSLVEAEAVVGQDESRDLYFLQANNDEPMWVFHTGAGNVYTQWDIPLKNTVMAGGISYVLTKDKRLYRLDDNSMDDAFNVTIQSGKLDFGSPLQRKHFRKVVAEYTINGDTQRNSVVLGVEEHRHSLQVGINVNGLLIFHGIYIELLEKGIRIPIVST